MMSRRDNRNVTPDSANDPDFVINLLGMRKEEAVTKLLTLLPLVPIFSERTRIIYLQIFPVFFSYTVALNRNLAPNILKIIDILRKHISFTKDKSLFREWKCRIKFVNGNENSNFEGNLLNKHHMIVISGTDFVDPICYAEIDYFISFHRYLKFHKLHKYLFFFGNLSYHEIKNINSENIRQYEQKVNILPMTEGARNAILRKLADLKLRNERLTTMLRGIESDDLTFIEKLMEEVRITIRTPIRNNGLVLLEKTDELPELLSEIFERLTKALILHTRKAIDKSRLKKVNLLSSTACSLLKRAWACYFFESNKKSQFNNFREMIEENLKMKKCGLIALERHYKLIAFVAAAAGKKDNFP